jgi:hypothetical protein
MARTTRRLSKSRKVHGNGGGYRGMYEDVMSLAGTLMRGQKDYGASKITSLADATREFAAAMPEMPTMRVYVDSAAARLEELSDYVAATDFDDMISDAGRLARRYPMATLGLAIAAGVGAAQFMHVPSFGGSGSRSRSSSRRRASSSRGRSRRGGRARANG